MRRNNDRDPVEVVLRFNGVWGSHDLEATLALLADDCVFESTGPAPDGVRHTGFEAIRAAWRPLFDDPNSVFEVEETIAAGERVVQRWRYSWGEGHIRGVDLFTVRDGLVAAKLSYVKG